MILTTLILKNHSPIKSQLIKIQCDNCEDIYEIKLSNQIWKYKKYNEDLCLLCIRQKQYKKAGESASLKMKGKTYEELYGKDKGIKLKENLSNKLSGKLNPNYNGAWYGKNPGYDQKGKSLEEIYGKEKAIKIRKKISLKSSGKNNPMYGKPSPSGSGNGWSGWYKNWYFRSLRELSYMINVIERFNLSWESAEKLKYKIEYIDWKGTTRTFHPDFIIEDKYLVEIKPKKLWGSDNVIRKKEAAIEFCRNKNLKYKLTESIKTLSHNELKILVNTKKIKFTKRYKEKFELWEKEN